MRLSMQELPSRPGDFLEIAGTEEAVGTLETNMTGAYYHMEAEEALSLLLPYFKEKVQLVYLDPPFFTGQHFAFRRKGAEGSVRTHTAYSDPQRGGRQAYLDTLTRILKGVHALLHPKGALYLHMDYRSASYLRLVLDDIFGEENLRNEIIWHYKSGGRAKRHFSRKHDTLLYYGKTEDCYFNGDAVAVPRGSEKRNHMKRHTDAGGRIFTSIRSGGREYRYYEDDPVYLSDVWDDISHLQQKDPERTGYETQKPEALLRRILLASSSPGDLICDFFSGAGTTWAVARKLGRLFLGADQSPFSLLTCRKRMAGIPGGPVGFIQPRPQTLAGDWMGLVKRTAKGQNVQLTLQPSEPALEAWSAGTIKDGIYVRRTAAFTDQKGRLEQTLTLPQGEPGIMAVHLTDAEGGQQFLCLPEA